MNAGPGAVVVLASTARIPVLTRLVTLLTNEPRIERTIIGGVPAMLAQPRPDETQGTIVFLNGGTRLGCDHPAVQRLVRGIGRAGCVVVAPELPGLKDGELTPATLEAVVAVASTVAGEMRNGRIAIFGVSAGASLALLAAADPALSGRVSVVVAIAPWADLESVVQLATTGLYDGTPHETTALVREFVAASLAAIPPDDRDGAIAQLSPLNVADRIQVPVELASAADDGYFPLAEAQKLAAELPDARLSVTSLLDHVRLRPAGRVAELARFWRFIARALAATTERQRNAAQPLKFLTVGTVGYVIGLLAFAALYAVGAPYAAASIAAYLFANALMYLGNRYFTFRLGHDGFWNAYGRYLGVGLLVAGVNVALLTAVVEMTGLDVRLGQAVSLLLISPAAFVLFKRWTFRLGRT